MSQDKKKLAGYTIGILLFSAFFGSLLAPTIKDSTFWNHLVICGFFVAAITAVVFFVLWRKLRRKYEAWRYS
jgi:uncharacterized membrane protein YeaQ/YmgE (transglycosylase-associated protein family)